MRPKPIFAEMQAVRPTPSARPNSWIDGIIVTVQWEEAGLTIPIVHPHDARWISEVQIGDDPKDLYELWFAEDHLQAR